MCGIYGSIGFDYRQSNFTQLLKECLKHRGPDAFNTHFDNSNKLFLAHSRLAVLDLSQKANQPMFDRENKNSIVFNGEIYNHNEIRKELEAFGETFETNSDTETILKGYKVWNVNILNKLEGMFAFAIWDSREKQIFIARDRMGEKPLYYTKTNTGEFIFSSELTPILINNKISNKLNIKAQTEYFMYGYVRGNDSIVEGIKKLPPAHYMIFKDNKIVKIEEYWKLSSYFLNKVKYSSFIEAQELCLEKLRSSVKKQLISDVPIGAFLSGGVDSSLISSIMAEQITKNHTFCAGFIEKDFDESYQAGKVASKIGANHHSFYFDNLKFDQIVLPFKHFDEPFSDSSSISMFYLSEFTRKKVTVILSGDGGDELFLGYPTYIADKAYNLTKLLPRSTFKLLSNFLNQFLKSNHGKVTWNYKIKAFCLAAQDNFENAHDNWRLISKSPENRSSENLFNDYWGHLPNAHYLDRSSYVDIKTWLVNDILFKVDRMSMAHSLEARSPFLDREVVEFAASLPIEYKLKNFNSKIILKKILNSTYGFNPQKKLGFSSPTSKWIKNDKKKFEDYLTSSKLWSEKLIMNLIEDHISLRNDNSYKIMSLIGYAQWHEKFTSICRVNPS